MLSIDPQAPGGPRRSRSFRRPYVLVLMPLFLALAYMAGGAPALGFAALAFPLALAVALPKARTDWDETVGLGRRDDAVGALDMALAMSRRMDWSTGAVAIEIDGFKQVEERHHHAALNRILRVTADRICDSLRDADVAVRLDGPAFAVALSPVRRLDLESAIQLASRIQRNVAAPISIDGANVYVTVSIGFCLAGRLAAPDGEALLQAANVALIEAQRNGPGAVRSFSEAMKSRISSRNTLSHQVHQALENGEIRAFFQPQVSTGTGSISGFEALARWHHPERGLIPPAEFLPALAQAGLMDRLGHLMLTEALGALVHWDSTAHRIPQVSVNFSTDELSDPGLLDRVTSALAQHGVGPERLVIEVLETVVASRADDIVIRNLAALADMGCGLDLDDFGTGHASITSIRRFSIARIKIDRSFVTRIDEDPEQQKMVSAILTMAERLGLDTLAEGVETVEEQEMLLKLGCGHVQGFALARPMPLAETGAWIDAYLRTTAPVTVQRLRAI